MRRNVLAGSAAALAVAVVCAGAAPAAAPTVRSCRDTQLVPNAGNLARIRAATLCLVNAERAKRRARPLRVRARLRAAASRHSLDMVKRHYFSHATDPGAGLNPNLLQLGRRGPLSSAENIAWGSSGFSTPQSVFAGWMSSTRHRRNMLSARYRFTGLGVAVGAPKDVAPGNVAATYTQVFSVR